jgi:hypothetical protein
MLDPFLYVVYLFQRSLECFGHLVQLLLAYALLSLRGL